MTERQRRKESREKYESYLDLEPGAWTKYRIVVEGTKARLFVHGAAQPCPIVLVAERIEAPSRTQLGSRPPRQT